MSILISNIRINIDSTEHDAIEKARNSIGIRSGQITEAQIYKKSIDARHKNNITYVVSVLFTLRDIDIEEKLISKFSNVSSVVNEELQPIAHGKSKYETPVIICGFGPAGIFAAYILAKEGYRPIVFERGANIYDRVSYVNDFWSSRIFSSETNVQFGEGGAGAFSDGKLTTRINDPKCRYILKTFVTHGAPSEIMYQAKPHVGTDKLHDVIKSMRNEIIKKGGEVNFNSKVDSINFKNGKVYSVTVNQSEIRAQNVILAIGHSARDTFFDLYNKGIAITPKSFSVGVRIEHRQKMINKALYGDLYENPNIPQGEYQLSYKQNDRCVYTFCMCPGGFVVASNSEHDSIVTNGMSYHSRNGANANSALVVSVGPNDFGNNPLDGINFQKSIEHNAFILGGKDYHAPATLVGDFLNENISSDYKSIVPTFPNGIKFVELRKLYPKYIIDMLEKGLVAFNVKLNGFAYKDAVMTGPETRTSSPIRITRGDDYCSVSAIGLYPCGEGAGYAGGIMSAAADGLKVAEKIINEYAAP